MLTSLGEIYLFVEVELLFLDILTVAVPLSSEVIAETEVESLDVVVVEEEERGEELVTC
jgi:hypothetical protein